MKKMKSTLVIGLLLIIASILGGCTISKNHILKGFYQSDFVDGYMVQISIQPQEHSFVEYIDNREVDKGTYEKIEDNTYRLKSDKQDLNITLDGDNSFEVVVKKINDGKPILMKNISDVPSYFKTKFDDIDQYKKLLD